MYQNQPPLQARAEDMARYGRYGDSMLVHMNPAEVQGIAALSPTGKLTINPVTGQPEAFLPFLAPILGSMFGSSLLAGSTLGGILGGAGLSSAAAGAIGSGLATTAVTGDLKKGLISGITGFGLGQALGAAGDALNPEIAGTTAALGDASTAAAEAGKNLALTAAETADPIAEAIKNASSQATDPITGELVNRAFSPGPIIDNINLTAANPSLSQAQMAMANPMQTLTSAEGVRNAANANMANLSGQIDSLRGAQTAGDRFLAPFKQPGAFGKALMKPANLAAVGVGEGKRAEIEAREFAEEDNKRFERDREAEYQRALGNMSGAYDQLESDYAYKDYQIPRYSMGGVTSIDPNHYAESVKGLQQLAGGAVQMFNGGEIFNNLNLGNSGPVGSFGSAQRQSGIRGPKAISSAELQGTRPGFDAEINYFPKRTPESAEDITLEPTGDSNYGVDLSGVDFSNLDLSQLGLGGFNQQISDYFFTPEGNATVGSIDQVLNNQEASAQLPVNPEYNYNVSEGIGNEPSINYDDILAETTRTVGNNTPPPVAVAPPPAAIIPPPSQIIPPPAPMMPPPPEYNYNVPEGIGSEPSINVAAPPPPITPQPAPMIPSPVPAPAPLPVPTVSTNDNFEPYAVSYNDDGSMVQNFGSEGFLDEASFLNARNNAYDFNNERVRKINAARKAPPAPMIPPPPVAVAPPPIIPPAPVAPPVSPMPMPRFEGIASLMQQPPPAPMTPAPQPIPQPAPMPMMPPPPVAVSPPPSINSPVNDMIGTLGGRGIGPDGLGTAGPRVYKGSGDIDLEALRAFKTPALSSRQPVKENSSAPPRQTKKGRGGYKSEGKLRKLMAEGGEFESMPMNETAEANGQLLIERAVQAISGQLSEEESSAIIASFVDQFGPEAFQILREKVLEEIVPGSQKQGEIIGAGGGMDDMVPGMIGNSQPVAVSPGEYIIPADVVSGLGDGSTDAGVGELDQMLDRVRQERTGTLRQPAPMSIGGVLPA